MGIKRNVIFAKAGGTAGKNSCSYKLSLPAEVIKALGVTPEDRGVVITIDGKKVIIQKSEEQS